MDPENIEPAKYYSPRQLVKMGVLPWRSAYTFGRMLREEKWRDVFKPVASEKKNGTRFLIKGENVRAFLQAADKGELSK